jgi:hypothetical protein
LPSSFRQSRSLRARDILPMALFRPSISRSDIRIYLVFPFINIRPTRISICCPSYIIRADDSLSHAKQFHIDESGQVSPNDHCHSIFIFSYPFNLQRARSTVSREAHDSMGRELSRRLGPFKEIERRSIRHDG